MIANNIFRKIGERPIGKPAVLAASVSYSGSESAPSKVKPASEIRQSIPHRELISEPIEHYESRKC